MTPGKMTFVSMPKTVVPNRRAARTRTSQTRQRKIQDNSPYKAFVVFQAIGLGSTFRVAARTFTAKATTALTKIFHKYKHNTIPSTNPADKAVITFVTTTEQFDPSIAAQYYPQLPDKQDNEESITLNDIDTPDTALVNRDDIPTDTLVPNDTSKRDSNKLEPSSPTKSDLTLSTTTPNPPHNSSHLPPPRDGKKYNATFHSNQVTVDLPTPETPSKLNTGQQLTPSHNKNLVYDAYCKKKRHRLVCAQTDRTHQPRLTEYLSI